MQILTLTKAQTQETFNVKQLGKIAAKMETKVPIIKHFI